MDTNTQSLISSNQLLSWSKCLGGFDNWVGRLFQPSRTLKEKAENFFKPRLKFRRKNIMGLLSRRLENIVNRCCPWSLKLQINKTEGPKRLNKVFHPTSWKTSFFMYVINGGNGRNILCKLLYKAFLKQRVSNPSALLQQVIYSPSPGYTHIDTWWL